MLFILPLLPPSAVASHRKPCGGNARNQCSPGLCHGPAQEEIIQGRPGQRCCIVEYQAKFDSQNLTVICLLTTALSSLAEGRQAADNKGLSKRQGRSQQSPEKSSSRSPLRNTTQNSNVHTNNSVEFREPLASYRYKQYWRGASDSSLVRVLVGENKTVFRYWFISAHLVNDFVSLFEMEKRNSGSTLLLS